MTRQELISLVKIFGKDCKIVDIVNRFDKDTLRFVANKNWRV